MRLTSGILATVALVAVLVAGVSLLPFGDCDTAVQGTLDDTSRLVVQSSMASIRVVQTAHTQGVTARLHGRIRGLGALTQTSLVLERSGTIVRIRNRFSVAQLFGWSDLQLDVVVPAGFGGGLDCEASAGDIAATGLTHLRNVKLHSSAGGVTAGRVRAGRVDLSSSAGGVHVTSVQATKATLRSSASDVVALGVSGEVTAHSSAGDVHVGLLVPIGHAEISSSAGDVVVRLPLRANAVVSAHTSAGTVHVRVPLRDRSGGKSRVNGTLGRGGSLVSVTSSAGDVTLTER